MRQGVAAEVRAEMARQRKTGVDLAPVLHLTQQSVSRRLTAETDISLDELVVIADWLGVDFTSLIPDPKASQQVPA